MEEKKSDAFETLEKINSVSVIIDDELWNGEVGDSLRNKFAAPVLGLQDEEPLFVLNQYPVKLLDGFLTKSRNIIVVKKDSKAGFSLIENESSTPKILVRFSGRTVRSLIDSIEVNAPKVANVIRNSEIRELQTKIRKSAKKTNDIDALFDVQMAIPPKYKTVLKGNKFLWLKKEITGGNMSIIAYKVPFNRLKDTLTIVNSISKIRDSIGARYIHGTKKRTRMVTEPAFTPYLNKISISDVTAYETKGTWDLKNEFMSGPFVNFALIDSKHNRILILEGFCYAPFKGKRDLMLELEAIIKTIKL